MSTHFSHVSGTHLIWETLNREPVLDKRAAAKASSLAILPIKKNLIASGLIRRSTRCLLSAVARNGELREPLKMVAVAPWRAEPQPEGWGE